MKIPGTAACPPDAAGFPVQHMGICARITFFYRTERNFRHPRIDFPRQSGYNRKRAGMRDNSPNKGTRIYGKYCHGGAARAPHLRAGKNSVCIPLLRLCGRFSGGVHLFTARRRVLQRADGKPRASRTAAGAGQVCGGSALPVLHTRLSGGHTRFRRSARAAEKTAAAAVYDRRGDVRLRRARLYSAERFRLVYLRFRFLPVRPAIQYLYRMPRRQSGDDLLHEQPAPGCREPVRRRARKGRGKAQKERRLCARHPLLRARRGGGRTDG